MHIFIYNNQCLNIDNDADAASLLEQGARELTAEEIRQYGMAGFEQYVNPTNTVVNTDGTVTFSPPDIAAEQVEQRHQEIFMELDRIDRASSRSLRAILTAQASSCSAARATRRISRRRGESMSSSLTACLRMAGGASQRCRTAWSACCMIALSATGVRRTDSRCGISAHGRMLAGKLTRWGVSSGRMSFGGPGGNSGGIWRPISGRHGMTKGYAGCCGPPPTFPASAGACWQRRAATPTHVTVGAITGGLPCRGGTPRR